MGVSFKITLNVIFTLIFLIIYLCFYIEIKYFLKPPYLFITIILFLFYQLYLNLVV